MTTTELGHRPQPVYRYSIIMARPMQVARQAPGQTEQRPLTEGEVIVNSVYLLHLAAGMGGCGPAEFEDEGGELSSDRGGSSPAVAGRPGDGPSAGRPRRPVAMTASA
jgi:hypothetical protein